MATKIRVLSHKKIDFLFILVYTSCMGRELFDEERVVDDGFGSLWEKCDRLDCSLQVVRPGSVQCDEEMVDGPNGAEWVSPCLWGDSGAKTNV